MQIAKNRRRHRCRPWRGTDRRDDAGIAASGHDASGGAAFLGDHGYHACLGSVHGGAGYPEHLRSLVEDYLTNLRFAHEPGVAGLEEAILPALDDDDLRRGLPTSHKRFGVDVAILAGDAVYAEAFKLVLREQRGEPERVLAAIAELADATGVNGMVGGEYIDVRQLAGAEGVGLRRLHRLKTGRLISAAVECVLLLSDVGASTLAEFREFAGELGVLFQIVDDILDVTGTEAQLGKPHGSDERHLKLTYVGQHGLQGARLLAAESHEKARTALAHTAGHGASELVQIAELVYTRCS